MSHLCHIDSGHPEGGVSGHREHLRLAWILIDRYGLFGVDAVALTWPRIAGIVLLSAGAALTLSR